MAREGPFRQEARRWCSLSVPENDAEQPPDSPVVFFFLIALLARRGLRLVARESIAVPPRRTRLAAAGVQRAWNGRLGAGDEDLPALLRAIWCCEHSRFGV